MVKCFKRLVFMKPLVFDMLLEKKDFFCMRCTGRIKNERYLLFRAYYCGACMNTIENDPDYDFIFKTYDLISDPLQGLRQIEN